MRLLFYLPVVTPWWFETIITPMLRSLYDEAELHVIVAPLWKNTGLEMAHVEPLADLPAINWHIVVPDDPAQFRLDGASIDGLLDLVHTINADITLVRSADRTLPAQFPGTVRHLMEPGAEPLQVPHRWFVLEEQPFHHGVMPESAISGADHAAALMAPHWDALEARYAQFSREAIRSRFDLPVDRPVLAVPLQYEHDENFYGIGSPFQPAPQFLDELLARLDERIMLAVIDHPLNARFLPRTELDLLAADNPDRVRILPQREGGRSPSGLLVRAADAVLIDRSKCVSMAAFFGTPIVHIGDSVMADWMNATSLHDIVSAGIMGLPVPDRTAARRWFGWHFGMRLTNFGAVTPKILRDRISANTDEAEIEQLLTVLAPWFEAGISRAEMIVAEFTQGDGSGGQIAA